MSGLNLRKLDKNKVFINENQTILTPELIFDRVVKKKNSLHIMVLGHQNGTYRLLSKKPGLVILKDGKLYFSTVDLETTVIPAQDLHGLTYFSIYIEIGNEKICANSIFNGPHKITGQGDVYINWRGNIK